MNFLRCFIYLFVCGVISFLLGRLLPYKWIREERFPFASGEAESRFYDRIGIRSWQKKLPDMSRIFPRLVPPKTLEGEMVHKLPCLIKETCIAELIHVLLAVAALYCMVIWQGAGGIIVTILFEIGNLPFIMIQRYNRPRLIKLHRMLCMREQKDAQEEQTAKPC